MSPVRLRLLQLHDRRAESVEPDRDGDDEYEDLRLRLELQHDFLRLDDCQQGECDNVLV